MYCLCFYLVTSEKSSTLRGIVLTAASVGGLQLYLRGEADTATAQTRIGQHLIDFLRILKILLPCLSGLLSSSMSVLYCAAPLASVVTVVRSRSTESLPFYLILATIAMTGSWTLYGFIIKDMFVILPNLLGCLIASGQLLLFVIYKSSNIKPEK